MGMIYKANYIAEMTDMYIYGASMRRMPHPPCALLLAVLQLLCHTAAAGKQPFHSFSDADRGSKSMYRTDTRALNKWMVATRNGLDRGDPAYYKKRDALMREFRAKKQAIKDTALKWSRKKAKDVRLANSKGSHPMILLEVDGLTKPHAGIESMCGGFSQKPQKFHDPFFVCMRAANRVTGDNVSEAIGLSFGVFDKGATNRICHCHPCTQLCATPCTLPPISCIPTACIPYVHTQPTHPRTHVHTHALANTRRGAML